ncbi:HD-GYP domain-containing protein [Shewanella yunxiaonensis]|uniref:HD-GYP domain-containing protein n=1 Tax=Shewanella yunxiaonensis TaxID=2829809 RepID=A0ABX7YWW8_9GAMM|nr:MULTISPECIES: HD-GYP domain-containing protein [Shewanella]MDF0535485.1 HD-GYP domain-containing protein [Shewanella sp. A32]QUN07308.1 HD-GYP domain-containing protein [Shewanella yunxiaonensis]
MGKSRFVSVQQLQVGNYVRLPVSWKDHPFLFSSFKLKQQAQIELIKKLGIDAVYVDLGRSDTEPLAAEQLKETPEQSAEELEKLQGQMEQYKKERIEILQRMRRDLQKTEEHFSRSLARMRNLIGKLRNRPLNAVNEAKELITDITEELLASDNLVLHLMSDDDKSDGIYFHSLNVAVLSMLMAKELGWARADIETVGLGALFHDIGKLKLPSQIIRKKEPLTTPEQNLYNQHPILGTDLLKLAQDFPQASAAVVTNHHELLDGSGFPRGLKADALSEPVQLAAVVNFYDSLCHPSNPQQARTPYAALGYLYKYSKGKFNQEYVGKIIKMLGIYPPGSVVELSSGQFGLVMSVNLDKILLPRILVYDPMVPKDQAPIVDLEAEGLSIVRCLSPAALAENIYKYLNPRERITYYFGSENKS